QQPDTIVMRIALTFDDGPHKCFTPQLLDAAAAVGAKLTFFVLGQRAAQNRDVVKRILDDGHEIGNHGWSHSNFRKISDPKIRSELEKTDLILRECGVYPRAMRPPYGEILESQRRLVQEEFDYRIV